MTLEEAKSLLSNHNIPYHLCEFQNEAEYWHHTSLFPDTRNAQSCKVTVIVIPSHNAHHNIELQFNTINGIPQFAELWFGAYSYEMFDCIEEMLANDLMDKISEIMQGNLKIIIVNDLQKKRCLGDAIFDLTGDDAFGEPGFYKAMNRITKKRDFWKNLRNHKSSMKSMIGIVIRPSLNDLHPLTRLGGVFSSSLFGKNML